MKITKYKFPWSDFDRSDIITISILSSIMLIMVIGLFYVFFQEFQLQKNLEILTEFADENCVSTGIALSDTNYQIVYSCPGSNMEEVISNIEEGEDASPK
jgi:hypothetical protein